MDAFTMVIVACVAGQTTCTSAHVSEQGFVTAQACEARMDDITRMMTREFGKREEFKGREVTYDVTCMDRVQLKQKFGIAQSDT